MISTGRYTRADVEDAVLHLAGEPPPAPGPGERRYRVAMTCRGSCRLTPKPHRIYLVRCGVLAIWAHEPDRAAPMSLRDAASFAWTEWEAKVEAWGSTPTPAPTICDGCGHPLDGHNDEDRATCAEVLAGIAEDEAAEKALVMRLCAGCNRAYPRANDRCPFCQVRP